MYKNIKNKTYKTAYLEIGDILFDISYPDSIIIAEPDEAYLPFVNKSDDYTEVINVKVTLDLNDMPHPSSEDIIFESDPFCIYKKDGFVILLKPPPLGAPLRMAEVNRDNNQVIVYLSASERLTCHGANVFQNPLYYPLDQIILTLFLAGKQGGLIHAGGIYSDNRAYLFPGKSGAGKSTLCRQFGGDTDFRLINDDRILIRKDKDHYMAYGTPWPGENRYTENIGLPLDGIFFINKGTENMIRQLKRQDAFERLMPVLSIPWYDSELVSNYFIFCEELIDQIPVYELDFKPDKKISNVFKEFVATR